MDDVNVLNEFQSTLSVRRATHRQRATIVDYGISIHALRKESDNMAQNNAGYVNISIHALRKESDICRNTISTRRMHFNPRSP